MSTEIHDNNTAEEIINQLKKMAENAANSVAAKAPALAHDRVLLDQENINGEKLPQKKARPKNHPEVQLVEKGEMLNMERWAGSADGTKATITFNAPDYYEKMIEQNPAREIIATDKLNPNVYREIVALIAEEFK